MAVKFYDNKTGKYIVYPGTVGAPGINAYQLAVSKGYTGTYEDYVYALYKLPWAVNVLENTDSTPTNNSNNLVTSNGVYDAIKSAENTLNNTINNVQKDLTGDINKIKEDVKNLSGDIGGITSGLNEDEVRNIVEGYEYLSEGDTLVTVNGVEWVAGGSYTIASEGETPDLSGYATTTDLKNVSDRVSDLEVFFETNDEDNLINKWHEIVDFLDATEGDTLDSILSTYATQGYVDDAIKQAQLEGEDVDLSEYVKQNDLNSTLINYAKTTDIPTIENNLTSTSITNALSANQGRILNENISSLEEDISQLQSANVLATSDGTYTLSELCGDNLFGVIIVPHGSNVKFTDANMMCAIDDSDGNYDVYCIMNANGKYLVNMAVYN